ncbi:MAG: TM2 domain-containing protein [Candidatus Protistobacter heckmanni]|nr:TM2 domain-containing protein [Candidatus Protistobacter heckmanni]
MEKNHKFKLLAALSAFLGGGLGLHRFYLYGARDWLAWLHLAGGLLFAAGVLTLERNELASAAGWLLAVPGSAAVLSGFITALVYGLRPDELWDAQFNAASGRKTQSSWGTVIILILALMIGTGLLMTGLAIAFEQFFQAQIEEAHKYSQAE